MLEQFTELEDRYEKEIEVNSNYVLVSLDKDEISVVTESILKHVIENVETIIKSALKYIEKNKDAYKIGFVNDLSEPQIIINSDSYSVYWYSEKGEEQGASVISADYIWPEITPQGITIGD